MDFFSAVRDGDQTTAPTGSLDVQVFANAVEQRFGFHDPANIIRARLTPVKEVTQSSASPSSSSSQRQDDFFAVTPSDLALYIHDNNTLIVDIRPHAAYSDARLPRALSLCVPSTLLKRPLFSLEKLAAMLPSPSHRSRFSAFRSSTRILVYDADATILSPSSNVCGLLRKFKAASYSGELLWLRGGFQAVWREQRQFVDTAPPPDEHDEDDERDTSSTNSLPHPVVLRPKNLPMSAFSLSTTTAANNNSSINTSRNSHVSISNRRPFISHHNSGPMQSSLSLPPSNPSSFQPAANPFYDTIRQNAELSQGITERIPLRLAPRIRRRIDDLPFPWLREIAKRSDLAPQAHHRHRHPHSAHAHPPPHTHRPVPHPRSHSNRSVHQENDASSSESSSSPESSDSDAAPLPAFIEEGTEALAMQFYRIELAEQRRLMGVMEHHSKESGCEVVDDKLLKETGASSAFPFSITAGVEKGAKNRYRHIWPFEHARVRLESLVGADKKQSKDNEDDYVNASYIQPLATNRRYIATQGPLEATFEDFWRLTWQQNVHVIVMLTKEVEGGMVKCGAYWADTTDPPPERSFGPLRLKLVSKVGLPSGIDLMSGSDEAQAALSAMKDTLSSDSTNGDGGGFGFDFHPFASGFPRGGNSGTDRAHHSRRKSLTTIKRTFTLSHTDYPHLGARTIVQLQYLDWPDMNIPEDPRGVLELVREMKGAVQETDQSPSPVVSSPSADEEHGSTKQFSTKMDARSGIARHALGGRRPVLLHCSAGVGRTGGFITVDAVLDAVGRELRQKTAREYAEGVKDTGTRTREQEQEDEDVMDIDNQGMVTVPVSSTVSCIADGKGDSNDESEFVMHIPSAPLPTDSRSNTDSHRADTPDTRETLDSMMDVQTPIKVDGNDCNTPVFSRAGPEAASTRKWAENVSNSYRSHEAPGSTSDLNLYASQLQLSQSPPSYSNYSSLSPSVSVPSERATPDVSRHRYRSPPQSRSPYPLYFPRARVKGTRTDYSGSTSSGSASGFPSVSDSEDSRRARVLRGGSSLSMLPAFDSSSFATSISSGGSDKEKDREEANKNEMQGQGQRFRTVSAPHAQVHARANGKANSLPLSSGLTGVGDDVQLSASLRQIRQLQETDLHAPQPVPATKGIVFPTIDQSLQPSSEPKPHLSSHTSPPLHAARVSQPPTYKPSSQSSTSASPPVPAVNYKEPRALHGKLTTPLRLSDLEEPILEVVQDMREQRMSLCQSLRQYVFVHQAIIEGALWIVDEERQKVKDGGQKTLENSGRGTLSTASEKVSSPLVQKRNALSGHITQPHIPVMPTQRLVPITSHVQVKGTTCGGMSDSGGSTTSSTGKRVASPTELLKEGKTGQVLLSKRPSIKRKLLSSPNGEPKTATVGGSMKFPSAGPTSTSGVQAMDTVPSSPPLFR